MCDLPSQRCSFFMVFIIRCLNCINCGNRWQKPIVCSTVVFFLKCFNIVLLIWFSQLKCECWQKSKLSRNIDEAIFLRGQLLLFTLLKHTTFIKYICFNTFEVKWTWSTGNSIVIVNINSYFIKRLLIYLTFKYFGLERIWWKVIQHTRHAN